MAWVIFDTFMEKQEDGSAVNLDTAGDTIKLMLVDDTRAPVKATDSHMGDIDDNEVSGGGYSAGGGTTIANQSITLAGGTVTFDCDDVTFSQATDGFSTARYAVLHNYTGSATSGDAVCYADLGGDKGNVDGDLTLEINAAGIFTKTSS